MKVFRILFCVFALACSLLTSAAPVERVRTLVRLVDGSEIVVTSMGDETLSFFVTDEGVVVEKTEEGYLLTGMTVDEYVESKESRRRSVKRKLGIAGTALLHQHGRIHIPLLLVSFADLDFKVAADSAKVNEYYTLFCNGERYTGHGSTGSVRDYFADMSLGEFQPEFTVIGPLRLQNSYSFYGKDSGSSHDVNYSAFLRETFEKAAESFDDWARFDNNGDCIVDMAMIVFAGMGQNYTEGLGISDVIWPKEMPTYIEASGIRFGGCSSTSETRPYSKQGTKILDKADGIGNFLHELSHALGLPDFYDTRYIAFGMDYWDIMDSGGYVNNGYSPVDMSAYEREFMGWQNLETLEEPCTVRLRCFADGGRGYKIVNDQNPNEYYVLENRQPKGWDKALCQTFGNGMMVTHIDYLQSAWTGNRVNTDSKHQRLTLIPANNSLIGPNNATSQSEYVNSMKGNLYPGNTQNYELTDESTPASEVFTGGFMGKPIYDIAVQKDGTVTLKFLPLGRLESPKDVTGHDTSVTDAVLEWGRVENAEGYNVEVYADGKLVVQADSLVSNTYSLEGLKSGVEYSFRIQAIADKWRNSTWSEAVISRDVEDAIASLPKKDGRVRVYNANGTFVTECQAHEVGTLNIPDGIYIIKNKDNETRKIVL